MTFKTVSVIGLGYIGLPTAAVMASRGLMVIGVDVSAHVIDTINAGKVHIVEPDLDRAVQDVVKVGRLRATTTPEASDAFVVAVPTPFKATEAGGTPDPDLSYIRSAATMIAPVLKTGDLVILESTSPVGATEQMSAWLADARPDLTFPQTAGENSDIRVAHCPERVLPGQVLKELVSNDRVVGGMTPLCAQRAVDLYRHFVEGECIVTDCRTAEMAKLTENSFRDVNIAFANELSLICDKMGIDVWELIRLANRHPRVNILQPGPGVGGHCIAVDPWFIVSSAPAQARLVRQAREVNDSKPRWVLDKIDAAIADWKKDNSDGLPTVACFGLAFKPNIDDLRESPALDITRKLAKKGGMRLLLVEPHIEALPSGLGDAQLVAADEALETADVCVLLVDHAAFGNGRKPDATRQSIIDTRGFWG
ncbi:UDP-N-acetyl-D-mannosaminuronic acid dehydrogenase [Ochrobactrum daejeonense]|uniref:UDP-N-acetyl-D-mannosaminuronic acid dehydrogenase n=1 Tax=Brucella daejeonensis TaxID=659015 RepID=A0A7W9B0A4_9HYPH|nr:UDP-N-acetyl-D-mannosamine dehydrogenase [Brucella daejeonensis]MBB5703762.1 UDP-N-acetyl-D-mannosaminuronic acid dehydrogenase [Brucella daejeonensis]